MNPLADPKHLVPYRADFSVGDFGLVKRAVSDVSPYSIVSLEPTNFEILETGKWMALFVVFVLSLVAKCLVFLFGLFLLVVKRLAIMI